MVDWGWLVIAFFGGQWALAGSLALIVWATYKDEWREKRHEKT